MSSASPLGRYTVLTLLGSAIWCFALAGVGWALGSQWEEFHHAFRYVDYAIIATVAAGVGLPGVEAHPARRENRSRRPIDWPAVKIDLVDVKAQYAPLIPELRDAFERVLESGRFIFGPEVTGVRGGGRRVPRRAARDRRRQRHRRDRARARGDGDRSRGDEVICPSFTFYATAEAIARAGATPVFADIDPVTLNLDPDDVARRITPRTKAIMPVHLFGRPAPLAELAALGLPLLEDAAQAFGAEGIATTGVCSTFSFFPTKNLFALGDGGLVAATDDAVAERVRMLRFHGSRDKKTFELIGTNSRLDALQAAFLRVFLPHLAGWNASRREAAARYAELGLGDAVELPRRRPRPRLPHVRRPLDRARPHRRGARGARRSPRPRTT